MVVRWSDCRHTGQCLFHWSFLKHWAWLVLPRNVLPICFANPVSPLPQPPANPLHWYLWFLSCLFLEFIFPQAQFSFLMLFSTPVLLRFQCAYQSQVRLPKLQLQSRMTEGSPWVCFSVKFPGEQNSSAQRTTLTSKAGDIFTSVLILISVYSDNYQAYQSLNLGPQRPWTFGPHR